MSDFLFYGMISNISFETERYFMKRAKRNSVTLEQRYSTLLKKTTDTQTTFVPYSVLKMTNRDGWGFFFKIPYCG